MNLIMLFIGLAELAGLVAVGVIFLVFCLRRNWTLAACTGLAVIGVIVALNAMTDVYVRKVLPPAKLVGTYDFVRDWSQQCVDAMGYADCQGEITLAPGGAFKGTQIPACCISGDEDKTLAHGYLDLSGTWQTAMNNNGCLVVRLKIPESALVFQRASPKGLPIAPDKLARTKTIDVYVMKARGQSLGFSIFNGDFYELIFRRRDG